MGLFFRKRMKIFPGVYLNFSKSGIGFSFGPKGCKMSVNSKGETYLNISSNGLYYRKKIKSDNTTVEDEKIECTNLEALRDKLILDRTAADDYMNKLVAMKELLDKGIITEDEFNEIKKMLDK